MQDAKTSEQNAELQKLADWQRTIMTAYMGPRDTFPAELRALIPPERLAAAEREFLQARAVSEKLLDDAVARGDVNFLREGAFEADMMLEQATREAIPEELDAQLRAKFGRGVLDVRKDLDARITRALDRGFIETEHEFQVINDRLSDVTGPVSTRITGAQRERLERLLGVAETEGVPPQKPRHPQRPPDDWL